MTKGLKIMINDKDLSDKLAAYSLSFNDKNRTIETADGSTYFKHLSKKATINLTWSKLSDDDIQRILEAINLKGRNTIEYYDYTIAFDINKRNNTNGYFYVDSRDAAINYIDGDNIIWQDFSLKFIEH